MKQIDQPGRFRIETAHDGSILGPQPDESAIDAGGYGDGTEKNIGSGGHGAFAVQVRKTFIVKVAVNGRQAAAVSMPMQGIRQEVFIPDLADDFNIAFIGRYIALILKFALQNNIRSIGMVMRTCIVQKHRYDRTHQGCARGA